MKAFNKKAVVSLIVMCSLTTAATVAPVTTSASGVTTPTIVVDGSTLSTDTAPYITNSTTMVPIRVISEELGASVTWDESTRSIHIEKGSRTVDLEIGKVAAKINGETVTATLAPTIVNNRTMVPLRFIGEALECDVDWIASTKTVVITTDGEVEEQPVLETSATDQYGRAIRTTNLPSNADDFPYIAEGVPNWCYELQPTIMKNNIWGPAYYTDTELKGDVASSVSEANSSLFPQNLSEGVYEMANKFVDAQLNIDYNTIDESWVETMLSCFSDTEVNALNASWVGDDIETVEQELESYVKYIKKYKMVTSCDYEVLPETMWVDVYGFPHFSVYVKYTLEQCDTSANSEGSSNEIRQVTYGNADLNAADFAGFEIGETYEAVVTYSLNKDSNGNWKITWTNCDADAQIIPSVDSTDGVAPSLKDANRLNDFAYYWVISSDTKINRYAKVDDSSLFREGFNPLTGRF